MIKSTSLPKPGSRLVFLSSPKDSPNSSKSCMSANAWMQFSNRTKSETILNSRFKVVFNEAVSHTIDRGSSLTPTSLAALLKAMQLIRSSSPSDPLVQDFWSILTQSLCSAKQLLRNCKSILRAILCIHSNHPSDHINPAESL